MNINNPFTNGEIKNYLLFYASILTIVILFFIASTLFNNVKKVDKKVFSVKTKTYQKKEPKKIKEKSHKFKLMDKIY